VAKPRPPRAGEAAFLKYVGELSASWDNLYTDRMKAKAYLQEAD
jgi:hypothetical protein